jgi:hypothetical protein
VKAVEREVQNEVKKTIHAAAFPVAAACGAFVVGIILADMPVIAAFMELVWARAMPRPDKPTADERSKILHTIAEEGEEEDVEEGYL